jgi:hypothetical protein
LMHLLVCSISDSLLHVWRTDGTNINIHAFCVPFCSEGCSSLCSALLTLYVFLLDALPFSSGHEQRHIWLIQLDIVRRQLSVFALLTMLSSCLRITRTKRQQWHSFFDSLWLGKFLVPRFLLATKPLILVWIMVVMLIWSPTFLFVLLRFWHLGYERWGCCNLNLHVHLLNLSLLGGANFW